MSKVCIVTPSFPPDTGGCSESCSILVDELRAQGSEVRVLQIGGLGDFIASDRDYIRISLEPRRVKDFVKIVRCILRFSKGYDYIHVYNVFLTVHTSLACLFSRRKLSVTLNNYNLGCINPIYEAQNHCSSCNVLSRFKCSTLGKNLTFLLIKQALRRVNRFFFFSEVMRRVYSRHVSHKQPAKFTKIHNFKPRVKAESVRHTEFVSRGIRFGYVGTLDERKGIDVFLEAIQIFRKERPNSAIRFYVYGSGKECYQSTCANDPWITYKLFSGAGDKELAYANLDCLVHPCRWNEPFARVWLESAYFGIGLMVSDCEGNRELLQGAASFFESGSAASLAREFMKADLGELDIDVLKTNALHWFQKVDDSSVTAAKILSELRSLG